MQYAVSADGDSQTPFGSLLLAVFNSILEVVLICSSGYILATRGTLDKKTQKQLNRLNVSLFTPALLFSKVALYLTPEKLKELWVIPIYFAIVTTVSMCVGSFLGWTFKLRQSQRSFVMAAAMFMNSNALPIALMQSLVVAVPDLMWGPDDNKNAMLGRALTYLTMYSTLGMVVRYSYGVHLLARADTVLVQAATAPGAVDERTPLLVDIEALNYANETLRTRPSTSTMVDISAEDSLVSSPKSLSSELPPTNGKPPLVSPPLVRRRTTFYNSFPNSANASRTNLLIPNDYSNASSDAGSDDLALPLATGGVPTAHTHHRSRLQKFGRSLKQFFIALNDFMTVPLWAALISLVVACIPPLQHALIYHLKPVNGAIDTAGKCSVPLTLVVLGAYFYTPPEEKDISGDIQQSETPNGHIHTATTTNEDGKSWLKSMKSALSLRSYRKNATPAPLKTESVPAETKTVILAVAARMIITPLLLLPLMVLATKYDFHAVFEDPVFVVCNIILLASPPALTLAQITQAVSGDAFERLISKTIFWSYCVCTPPVTIIYVVLGLMLAKL